MALCPARYRFTQPLPADQLDARALTFTRVFLTRQVLVNLPYHVNR